MLKGALVNQIWLPLHGNQYDFLCFKSTYVSNIGILTTRLLMPLTLLVLNCGTDIKKCGPRTKCHICRLI